MHSQHAIEAFLEMLVVEKAASACTIKAYKHDLERFFQNTQKAVEYVCIEDIREHIDTLSCISAYTVRRFISSARHFFLFFVQEGFLKKNPMEGIVLPKLEKNLPKIISEQEVEALIQKVYEDQTHQGVRNAAIIEVLYATGMRVSELIHIKQHDILFDDLLIKVLGKRSRERFVLIHQRALDILQKYTAGLNKDVEWLFPSPRNAARPMTRQSVFLLVKKLAAIVNISPSVISPHVLRHAFATHMLERGADLFVLQALLGHKSVASTQVYTHVSPDKLKAFLNEYHPLGAHERKSGGKDKG